MRLRSTIVPCPPTNSPAQLLTSISFDFQVSKLLFRLVQRRSYCHRALQTSQSHVLAQKPGFRRGAERDNRAASLPNAAEEHAKRKALAIARSNEYSRKFDIGRIRTDVRAREMNRAPSAARLTVPRDSNLHFPLHFANQAVAQTA